MTPEKVGLQLDFDLLNAQTTFAVINGFFRKNGFFNYKVRIISFMSITSKYLKDYNCYNLIKFGNNLRKFYTFIANEKNTITDIALLNENFIVTINYWAKKLLSNLYFTIQFYFLFNFE